MRDTKKRALPKSAHRLRREVLKTSFRARLILLAQAFLAAVAADLLYDLLNVALFITTGRKMYFPPFFLVVLAVFSVYALRKTRILPFSRMLDANHRLKDRLASAYSYRRSGRVPRRRRLCPSAQVHPVPAPPRPGRHRPLCGHPGGARRGWRAKLWSGGIHGLRH
jgi:hypothetical protein